MVPTGRVSFLPKPFGFFDWSPALDVAPAVAAG